MKVMIKKTAIVLVLLGLLLTACGGGNGNANSNANENNENNANAVNNNENENNNDNVDENNANEVNAPDAVPPTEMVDVGVVRTPMPTARPISAEDDDSEPGVYVNPSVGVSVEYPEGSSWEILFENEGSDLVGVKHSNLAIYLFLQAYPLGEDEILSEIGNEILVSWFEAVGTDTENNRVIDDAYTLPDGTPAWRGILYAGVNGNPGEFLIESILVEHDNQVVVLSIFSWDESLLTYDDEISTFRNTLTTFPPVPGRSYGVDRENALFLSGAEPDSFDPALWKASAAGIVGDLFSGLVRLDTNLQPIPDLAEGWEVSADGLIYTFHLRKGVTFHSGRAFTAEDVRFSWERALDPALESVTAPTYLADILGAQAILDGETTELSGLEIVDEYTIKVTLDAPKAYFLYKLAYPTSWIVDSETVDEIDDNPIGTGPFRMVQHDEDELIILERNPYYHERNVSLEYVVYVLYTGSPTRAYENDEIDLIGVSEDLLERVEDVSDPLHGTVLPSSSLCTTYVIFDNTDAPFDDENMRKAFAMVLDKVTMNDMLNDGKSVIATGLYPPGMPGYNPDAQDLPYDVPAAQALFAASSYADDMPEIIYTTRGAGGDLSAFDATLIQAWESAFGVEIIVEQLDYERAYEEIIAGNHGQLQASGWCADYPDPENFADILFHTNSEQNLGDYTNADIDALLEAARSEADINKRMQMYQEIEQMLIDDAAAVFLFHAPASYAVTKTYVQGYANTPIGVAQHMNITLDHSK